MCLFLAFEIGNINSSSASTRLLNLELQSDSEFGIVILNANPTMVLNDGASQAPSTLI